MPIFNSRSASTSLPQNARREARSSDELAGGPIRIAIVESNTDFNRNGSLKVSLQGSRH